MSDAKVYLGNLSYDIRERDLEKFLKGYGRIRNISVKEGYGFAEFEDRRDAEDAVKDLDGKTIDGRRVRVEHTRDSRFDGGRSGGGGGGGGGGSGGGSYGRGKVTSGPPGQRTGYRLVVENLSSSTSWQDLKDYMRQAGEVTYTNTHQNRNGEGIVEFGSRGDMEYALDKLDGSELAGRRIKLYEENKGRGGGRSRSRSRSSPRRRDRESRSRSRSRSRSKSRDRSRSKSGGRRDRSRSRS
jgi:arginine/serine-rich splicing factor 4/5/6